MAAPSRSSASTGCSFPSAGFIDNAGESRSGDTCTVLEPARSVSGADIATSPNSRRAVATSSASMSALVAASGRSTGASARRPSAARTAARLLPARAGSSARPGIAALATARPSAKATEPSRGASWASSASSAVACPNDGRVGGDDRVGRTAAGQRVPQPDRTQRPSRHRGDRCGGVQPHSRARRHEVETAAGRLDRYRSVEPRSEFPVEQVSGRSRAEPADGDPADRRPPRHPAGGGEGEHEIGTDHHDDGHDQHESLLRRPVPSGPVSSRSGRARGGAVERRRSATGVCHALLSDRGLPVSTNGIRNSGLCAGHSGRTRGSGHSG